MEVILSNQIMEMESLQPLQELVEIGHLIEIKPKDYHWTKKNFISMALGFARIVDGWQNKLNLYIFALKLKLSDFEYL